jgi:hypothetical protein
MKEKQPYFAIGVDGHASPGFFASTDPQRFAGTHPFESCSRNSNDEANRFIAETLCERLDIHVVFSPRFDQIRGFMQSSMLKIFLYHPVQGELSESSEVILQQKGMLTVFLYGLSDSNHLPPIPGYVGLFGFPAFENCIIMIKSNVLSLVKYVRDKNLLSSAVQ